MAAISPQSLLCLSQQSCIFLGKKIINYNKHIYALDLLKKTKALHYAIEQLRAPKFFSQKNLIETLENHYIPKIEEHISSKVIEIQSDLIMAKSSLLKNKNLQEVFHSTILEQTKRLLMMILTG